MTSPRDTLAPCPFCSKGVAVLTHARELADDPDDYTHSDSYAVICDAARPLGPGGCGASGGFFPTEDEAIAAWNRRAAAPTQEPPVAQAEPLQVPAYTAAYRDAVLDLIDDCPGLTIEQDSWLTQRVKELERNIYTAPAQPDHAALKGQQ